MNDRLVINSLGQQVGFPVPNYEERSLPPRTPMEGRTCRVEPLNVEKHAQDLYDAFSKDKEGRNWTYLKQGPFHSFSDFRLWFQNIVPENDRLHFVAIDRQTNSAVGMLCFQCIDPKSGAIEIGNVHFSPVLQRTTMATETFYLMLRRAFDELGYRRCAYRCDIGNTGAKKAIERFGFHYEGTFRQLEICKGQNRDIMFFSAIDSEWPKIRTAYEKWLRPENFDKDGNQRQSLSELLLVSKL